MLHSRALRIMTEEKPGMKELTYICKRLGRPGKPATLAHVVTENNWNGTFRVDGVQDAVVQLVRGSGSMMDYVVYEGDNTTPALLLESTKTISKDAGNALYQRCTKLIEARLRWPDVPLVHMTTGTELESVSYSQIQQLRLFKTLGFECIDGTERNLLAQCTAYESVDTLIQDRAKCKMGKVFRTGDHEYAIEQTLRKGKNYTIASDPGKGAVISIANAIYHLDPRATFVVTNHGVNVETLKASRQKFWTANRMFDLKLEGSHASSLGVQPQQWYFTADVLSEKAASVLFHQLLEQSGHTAIFHNHSSSAKSFFLDEAGKEHQVPKSTTIPDIVFRNDDTKTVYICEGKVLSCIPAGIHQLDALVSFESLVSQHYPNYKIEKGLCVYTPDMQQLPEYTQYPIWFALDSRGSYFRSAFI